MLKKDKFLWSDSATQAFNELKLTLISAPVLALPYYFIPFIVETYDSSNGVAVVRMQNDHTIAFLIKVLSACHVGFFHV